MIAGMDRYVQICKCFRDEDLRADRQPEFTQVDVEMSFARPETIFGVIEPLMREIFTLIGHEIDDAVPADAVLRSDGDLRFGQARPAARACRSRTSASCSASRLSASSRDIVAEGGTVRGVRRAECGGLLSQRGRRHRQPGKGAGRHLVWARRVEDGTITSSITKAVGEEGVRQTARRDRHGEWRTAVRGRRSARRRRRRLLGQLRLTLAKKDGLLNPDDYEFLWVVDFPLLEWDRRGKALRRRCTTRLRRRIDDDLAEARQRTGGGARQGV